MRRLLSVLRRNHRDVVWSGTNAGYRDRCLVMPSHRLTHLVDVVDVICPAAARCLVDCVQDRLPRTKASAARTRTTQLRHALRSWNSARLLPPLHGLVNRRHVPFVQCRRARPSCEKRLRRLRGRTPEHAVQVGSSTLKRMCQRCDIAEKPACAPRRARSGPPSVAACFRPSSRALRSAMRGDGRARMCY